MNMKPVGPAFMAALLFACVAPKQARAELLTVTTLPDGLTVMVDGTNYTAPVTFDWPADSVHSLNTPSPQVAGDGHSRASFAAWSDGGDQAHSITVPAYDTTNTATFVTQYPSGHRSHAIGGGRGHERSGWSLVRRWAIGLPNSRDQRGLPV